MTATFDQGNQHTDQQINVAGNFYHYGTAPHGRTQPSTALANRPAVLHNLPQRDYTQFIGRAAELQKVQQILRPYPHSQHAFVSIDGIGGVGKSTLALEVAHRYLDQHETLPPADRFAAIIWTSAKERTLTGDGIKPRYQTNRTLDDLYRTIAITLQREDIAKALFDQQAALLHTVLIQQRTLVIVDNLETIDDEAVINFIRELPAPTKVIVTTRHRIDVAYAVRLTGMPWEDAERLIVQECRSRLVELMPADRRRFFDRTGGVPLAIVWSVAQMGFGYPAETVLVRLGSPTNDIIRFCFDQAVEQLAGQPAEKLLIALSYFTGAASREALGQVAQLSVLDRDDGLVALEKLSLVNKQGNLFSLLPVTKVFAEDLAKRNDQEYIHYGKQWLRYFQSRYSAKEEFTADFRLQYGYYTAPEDGPNLSEAVEWAHQHGSADDIFSITIIAASYLDTIGEWNRMHEYLLHALDLAHTVRNLKAQAHLSHTLGWLYEQWGNLEVAAKYIKGSEQNYRQAGDQGSVAASLQRACAIYRKQKNFAEARRTLTEARQLSQQLMLGDVEAFINTEEGRLHRDQAHWNESWTSFSRVRDYFEAVTIESPLDQSLAVGTWGHLAIIAYHQGRPEEAKALCLRSIEFFRENGSKGYLGTLHYRLALAEESLGEVDAALNHVNEALHWFQRLGMQPDIPDALALKDRLEGQER
ncbi:MAG: tetratricopeptide repeat protein [Caldilineaceae bacterium]